MTGDPAVVVVDIDGVLCDESPTWTDYAVRPPVQPGIDMVRGLVAAGVRVVLHTARWPEDEEVTRRWLAEHDVPFDRLVMGKPLGDVYVDDRAMRTPVTAEEVLREVSRSRG